MNKSLLLFHTVKYLKFSQIFHRILKRFQKPTADELYCGKIVERAASWKHCFLHESKVTEQHEACFLNYSKQLNLPADWDDESPSKLWVYNLHYFEDLFALDAFEKDDLHRDLLLRWVHDNPIGKGNGWEPYPISLRVTNICKAWLGGLELDESIVKSVFEQASYLSNDLETHLLGNHYFVNLKALLFAGVIFENDGWLKIAKLGLSAEIPEQILDDGGNFELSPMYHNLILVDMLDMYNLAKSYPQAVGKNLTSLLEKRIPGMLNYMVAMSHPDSSVSFFNDSANAIAPKLERIVDYSTQLGFEVNPTNKCFQFKDFPSSGYMVVEKSGAKLIFDAASVGPNYIPGHAHADTLSFEMSIGIERVFVNSGTSEYGLSEERLRQRKTLAHNTVEVDGKDSSQVWSGFRVAKRARIVQRHATKDSDGNIVLKAVHDGYKQLFGGCLHARQVEMKDHELVLVDELQGRFDRAVSRLHLHPDLAVTLEDGLLKVVGKSFEMISELSSFEATLEDTSWHPEFGKTTPNKVINVIFTQPQNTLKFTWKHC